MLTDKLKTLIIMGLKTTGNYDDALLYIEEELTLEEYDLVERFFRHLKNNNLTIGHGNIDERFKKWGGENSGTVKKLENVPTNEELEMLERLEQSISLGGILNILAAMCGRFAGDCLRCGDKESSVEYKMDARTLRETAKKMRTKV